MKYEVDNKKLIVEGKTLEFNVEIRRVLRYQDGLVVQLKMSPGYCIDNVFFINEDGTIRWQIEPFSNVKNPKYTGYGNIWANDDGLHADMVDGYDCIIDAKTGKILSRVFSF